MKIEILPLFLLSPSSRRAWIEIDELDQLTEKAEVALLAEGVDRNILGHRTIIGPATSPSSRRAWIEILSLHRSILAYVVALLAEGVDRN